MAYKSRKRNYKSRRQRLQDHWRNFGVIIIFTLIALAILLYKNRVSIIDWIKTYFY